ncbi:type IV toxin-antitoxin system AbiEi family antitoxin domain-containing protein [Egicoccus sp. AB-alg2]|uniref:type IV toxin-antitoxin system AbiEi family antitoxin domain-containing protein n=1 Tax=Egicoccus sp. AB-alg2 TaxID=3242693 RepID=UPI00359D5375
MSTVDERAIRAASGQRGLLTRSQLAEAGVSPSTIARRLSKGRWTEKIPGVIDLGTHEHTWRRHLQQLLLAAGPESWVSHLSAAHLHAFLDIEEPPTHDVVVRRGRHPRVGTSTLHTTTALDEDETTVVGGLRCTTKARTLLDVAPQFGLESLERLAADLARKDRQAFRQLGTVLARSAGSRGRRRLLTALSRLPDDVAKLGSPLEVIGVPVLMRNGAPQPKLQYRVRDAGGSVIKRVDAAWPRLWTIVEFDGGAWHDTTAARAHDEAARDRMRALGWTVEVLRFQDLDGPRPAQIAARLRELHAAQ